MGFFSKKIMIISAFSMRLFLCFSTDVDESHASWPNPCDMPANGRLSQFWYDLWKMSLSHQTGVHWTKLLLRVGFLSFSESSCTLREPPVFLVSCFTPVQLFKSGCCLCQFTADCLFGFSGDKDLLRTLAELKHAHRKLNEQNSCLLRTVAQCEDINLQLTLEITELRAKLTRWQMNRFFSMNTMSTSLSPSVDTYRWRIFFMSPQSNI